MFDWNAQGFPFEIINTFLTELAEAMHNATPPLGEHIAHLNSLAGFDLYGNSRKHCSWLMFD
jgi:hypothetical protein